MSSSSLALADAYLTIKKVPLRFLGLKHSTWSREEVEEAVKALGGITSPRSSKLDLFERLHTLRPRASRLTKRDELKLRQARVKVAKRKAKEPSSNIAKHKLEKEKRALQAAKRSRRTKAKEVQSPVIELPEDCEVCSEPLTYDLIIRGDVTSSCTHGSKPPICRPCLQQSVIAQSSSNDWGQLHCPVSNCSAIIHYNDIQRLASTEVFQRYDNYLLHQAISSESTYRQCAYHGCDSGGICDPERGSFVTCGACERLTCISCNTSYHLGQSCAENQEEIRKRQAAEDIKAAEARREANEKSLVYMTANTKVCPNEECGASIQKAGGCDHMMCRRCFYEFCWLCKAPYHAIRREGNHMHAEDCRYHTARLATTATGDTLEHELGYGTTRY